MKKNTALWLLYLVLLSLGTPVCAQIPDGTDKGSDHFLFLVNSDPQMGDAGTRNRGLKILNQLLERFVSETNTRTGQAKPAFVVWNGDLVWMPYPNAFANFKRIVSALDVPSVLVHGNHDGNNNDPQFLDLQQAISGYRKLNYSFDYGQWHFVVMASQPKYDTPEKKRKMLQWLDDELKKNKDKPVMLFMHYHLLPVGLSQMEYYSYTPASFRKEMLDTVTRYGNVKYVFSGHVHSGVKSSVKSSKEYKGTKFVVVPTPVFQRPFGEEYPEFSDPGKFDKRGYYLEVHVDGQKVKLIGRKINHPAKKPFPEHFASFSLAEDRRSFYPEAREHPNNQLLNGGFDRNLDGWMTSYRYHRDKNPMFVNTVKHGKNVLRQRAGYGSWNFDEYQETYQLVKWKPHQANNLSYHFSVGPVSKGGAGGYIRVFSYLKDGELGPSLLFHWGNKESGVINMPRAWLYNTVGGDKLFWLDGAIQNNQLKSFTLPIKFHETNYLDLDLNRLVLSRLSPEVAKKMSHLAIAHGTWTRVSRSGMPFVSTLSVDAVRFSHESADRPGHSIMFNGKAMKLAQKDTGTPYFKTKLKAVARLRQKVELSLEEVLPSKRQTDQ
jgi:3',5'-cyclic AMP phosphodiesterase CpdA